MLIETGRDRRQHTRYDVPTQYTGVAVRRADETEFTLEGHAYDVSAGGMRFELDEALEPGTRVVCRIDLPGAMTEDAVVPHGVFVSATVVWVEPDDLETGGSCRMACVFTNYQLDNGQRALEHQLERGRFRLAA